MGMGLFMSFHNRTASGMPNYLTGRIQAASRDFETRKVKVVVEEGGGIDGLERNRYTRIYYLFLLRIPSFPGLPIFVNLSIFLPDWYPKLRIMEISRSCFNTDTQNTLLF